MSRFSTMHTLASAFRFMAGDIRQVLACAVLPVIAGGITLYLSLYLYLLEFERYLADPNDRAGSLVLGAATAGLVLTLFMHSVAAAAIGSRALGLQQDGFKYFSATHRAWRLYAAYLRFLLLCAALVVVIEVLKHLTSRVLPGMAHDAAFGVALVLGMLALVARAGFLITPVAIAQDKGRVVREVWRLSRHYAAQFAIIIVTVLLVAFAVESAGEQIIRALIHSPSFDHGTLTLQEAVRAYRALLPNVVAVITVAYFVALVLMTAAASAAYRQITAPAQGEHH